MDVRERVMDRLDEDPEWVVVGAVAVLAVAGILVWTGMQEFGAPEEPRIDAPDGPEDGDDTPEDSNQTVQADGAARLDVWAPGPLTCADESDREAVQVRNTEQVEGGTQFLVNGTIRVSDPCESLDATIAQEGGGYVLRITSSDTGTGFCAECVAASSYTARLVVPADRLTVMHEGDVIDVLTR